MSLVYAGQRVALATRHDKERVIAPALAAAAGLRVIVPPGVDTDALGTFTGEVPRLLPMLETAREKARLGMDAAGLALGLASEGSFGPHPSIPFLAAGRELLVFIDRDRGIEIVEQALTEETNFAALPLAPGQDLEGFLERTGFPAHALILRAGPHIVKGIASRPALAAALRRHEGEGEIRLETDMRAHMNPTRMAAIGRLAERLARRLATPCPACGAPGFGPVRTEAGLRCSECGSETGLVRAVVHGCANCGFERSAPRSDGRATASPAECPNCNP